MDLTMSTIMILAILALLQVLLVMQMARQQKQLKNLQQMEILVRDTASLEQQARRTEQLIREEMERNRQSYSSSEKEARRELTEALRQFESTTERRMDRMREVMELKMAQLQTDNNKRLDQMRETVDEKLHKTLENRLGESFKQVSERLEQVHKGLGEMQSLAAGVGDLKKVLSNVKTRGTLGEYQLENILEQILAPEQYGKNVMTRPGSQERVEFAVKMPGRQENGEPVWLPIDAKFPTEDYQQLLQAYETSDLDAIADNQRKLTLRIKSDAKHIRNKYIESPYTTDFGVLFLPFEGLYAEVLRLDLFETLQREYKVMIAGPTTLAAFLNSLQMGFRTLAIEKRSSEVWQLLGAVKSEFGKFGGILDKTKKKLEEASRVIDSAGTRTRAIERRLRDVQEMPETETRQLLGREYDLKEEPDLEDEDIDGGTPV